MYCEVINSINRYKTFIQCKKNIYLHMFPDAINSNL